MLLAEKFEVHSMLNPKLWKHNELLPEVRERLLQIADQFVQTADVPLNIVDIRIVGSNVSYNYTQFSDIDLHIVCNFELMEMDPSMAQIMYNAVKAKFNQDYDISIRGIDVELYVEDVKTSALSNGIYSLLENRWIKFPKKIELEYEIDVQTDVDKWSIVINDVLTRMDSDEIQSVINELYNIRKSALECEGEFSSGNQLFKEIRNIGLLDKLKSGYKQARSKELTLEHLLAEDSRASLISKSKKSKKGFQRFKQRVKSRVANTVKQYNSIDMNKLFKENILTVDVAVKGETDNYTVRISYGGFLDLLHDQLHAQGKFDLKSVTRALINGFNRDDVYIHCSCPDSQYRFGYWQTRNKINSGTPENRPSNITNPDDSLGAACKHVLLVLSNTSWILKVGSTIFNYVNYMEKHYKRLYSQIIYPAIYEKEYEEPVQLELIDDDSLVTDSETIDSSNTYAKTKNQFKTGNQYRFEKSNNVDDTQISIDDTMDTELDLEN